MAVKTPAVRPKSPDRTAATSVAAYPGDIDSALAVKERLGDPFAPYAASETVPNMTVKIGPGYVFVGGVLTEVAEQTTPTFTAPGSNSRYDRIVRHPVTGVISVVAGTAAASPALPDIPAGYIPVAYVLLTAGQTYIAADSIYDERVGTQLFGGPGLFSTGLPDNTYVPGWGWTSSASTMTAFANRIYYMPSRLDPNAFNRLAINVTAGAGSNARVGWYNMAKGLPTTKKYDWGLLSTASIATVEATLSSPPDPGFGFFAIICDNAPTLSLMSGSANMLSTLVGNNAIGAASSCYGFYSAGSGTTLPDTAGSLTAFGAATPPAMMFRKV